MKGTGISIYYILMKKSFDFVLISEHSKPKKVFGVHLETVLAKEPEGVRVPHVVTKIVEYISSNGIIIFICLLIAIIIVLLRICMWCDLQPKYFEYFFWGSWNSWVSLNPQGYKTVADGGQ